MPFKPAAAPDHTVKWVAGTPTVIYECACRQQVQVPGVTTVGGALAATAAAGIHQH